jgi:DNA-binding response OmpR family regulator
MDNLENIQTIGKLTFDFIRHVVSCGERRVELTHKEFLLFLVLCSNAGRVLSRDELLESCWGGQKPTDRIVDTNICRLRKKLQVLLNTGRETIEKRYQQGYSISPVLIGVTV